MDSHVDAELYTNPMAPEEEYLHHHTADDADLGGSSLSAQASQIPESSKASIRLSNSDFRKLMMTPRPAASSSTSNENSLGTSGHKKSLLSEEESERRNKKKNYFAKIKKIEKDGDDPLSSKYRDRARERRDGKIQAVEETDSLNTTADYRAVAPTATVGASHAERRRQAIQESKYLGGDMEHTHLVKGLDFALLEKVRAELTSKEKESLELEMIEKKEIELESKDNEDSMMFTTPLGKKVFQTLFKPKQRLRNELFAPGRMAYRVDLDMDEEYMDMDIPTTVIRSKADCAHLADHQSSGLSTNEMVINKLTQILSYLRAGKKQAKKAKQKGKTGDSKDDANNEKKKRPDADMGIYDDLNEFSSNKRDKSSRHDPVKDRRDRDKRGDRDRDPRDERRREHAVSKSDTRHRDSYRDDHDHPRETRAAPTSSGKSGRKSYFEKPEESHEGADSKAIAQSVREVVRDISKRADRKREPGEDKSKEKDRVDRIRRKIEISGYDECYPGFAESYDAMGDSDDEVDFSHMDLGNKKGPVGRWDFETAEEYGDYMANKEALPKAAFQYGVKMADGRKTRRIGAQKDEKAALDRQWQKIQSMINKRKGGDSREDNGDGKKSKYE